MIKLSGLLKQEARRFNNIVYLNFPYSCCLDEAVSHAAHYQVNEKNITIDRTDKQTNINIKPTKGSGKRKIMVIKLWVN